MAPPRRLELLALAAVLTMLGLACGRTELDQPTGAGGTTSGAGGTTSGAGGTSAGAGGTSAGAGGTSSGAGGTSAGAGGSAGTGSAGSRASGGISGAGGQGPTVTCLDGASCGQGKVCCLDLLTSATVCEAPAPCSSSLGVALCASDAQCPPLASHCCRIGGTGVCSAQPCP